METTASIRVSASERLLAAFAAVRELDLPDSDLPVLRAALDVAEIVRTLDADDDVVIAAMLHPLLDAKLLDREAAEKRFGADALRLARALSQLGEFGLPADWTPEQGLESGQAEDRHDHHGDDGEPERPAECALNFGHAVVLKAAPPRDGAGRHGEQQASGEQGDQCRGDDGFAHVVTPRQSAGVNENIVHEGLIAARIRE